MRGQWARRDVPQMAWITTLDSSDHGNFRSVKVKGTSTDVRI